MPQAVPYILIYHRVGTGILEWATKYSHTISLAQNDSTASDIALAEAELCDSSVTFNRWEGFNAAGVKQAEGNITGVVGQQAGDMMPIHYAMLLRLNAAAIVGRPSTRYIHGWVEGWQTDGTINAAGLTAVTAYQNALAAMIFLTDSDGSAISSITFRGFSRRKRMRRALV